MSMKTLWMCGALLCAGALALGSPAPGAQPVDDSPNDRSQPNLGIPVPDYPPDPDEDDPRLGLPPKVIPELHAAPRTVTETFTVRSDDYGCDTQVGCRKVGISDGTLTYNTGTRDYSLQMSLLANCVSGTFEVYTTVKYREFNPATDDFETKSRRDKIYDEDCSTAHDKPFFETSGKFPNLGNELSVQVAFKPNLFMKVMNNPVVWSKAAVIKLQM